VRINVYLNQEYSEKFQKNSKNDEVIINNLLIIIYKYIKRENFKVNLNNIYYLKYRYIIV